MRNISNCPVYRNVPLFYQKLAHGECFEIQTGAETPCVCMCVQVCAYVVCVAILVNCVVLANSFDSGNCVQCMNARLLGNHVCLTHSATICQSSIQPVLKNFIPQERLFVIFSNVSVYFYQKMLSVYQLFPLPLQLNLHFLQIPSCVYAISSKPLSSGHDECVTFFVG